MRWHLRVVLSSADVQLRQAMASLFLLLNALVQPFFIGVTAMFMLRHRSDFEAVYVVIGVGLSGLWTMCLFTGSANVVFERDQGNLEVLAASPAPLFAVFGGKMLANLVLSLTSMVLSYGIGSWLFGYPVVVREPLAFVVSLLLALCSLWAMGMLFSPLSIIWPAVQSFLSGLEYPVYILSGFLFPVLLLPGWLLPISLLLPPYWAATALHGTALGSLAMSEVVWVWVILLLTSVLVLILAAWLFQVFVARARRDGTLGYV